MTLKKVFGRSHPLKPAPIPFGVKTRILGLFDNHVEISLDDFYIHLSEVPRAEVHRQVVSLRKAGHLKLQGGLYQRVWDTLSVKELSETLNAFAGKKKLGFSRRIIAKQALQGAYTAIDSDLGFVEFFLHEIAHVMTLGVPFSKIPKGSFHWVDGVLGDMPGFTSDIIEIDTACIAYHAGVYLGLWDDHAAIMLSCRKNTRSMRLDIDNVFSKRFEKALSEEANQTRGYALATFVRSL